MAEHAADAVCEAVQAAIAWYHDPLGGDPDWSLDMGKFWMRLADQGYEVVRQHTDGGIADA